MYKPDLVLMPIGGGQFVMNPADAAFAARELTKPNAVIPMHYGTNAMQPGTPAELVGALVANSGVKVLEMQPGDKLEF
jgi:L-ascorbate metabolism protein UlaG (beta-lactamase superfamily)